MFANPVRLYDAGRRWLRKSRYSPFKKDVFRVGGETLAYHPVPKNACSTVKSMLAQATGVGGQYIASDSEVGWSQRPRKMGEPYSVHMFLAAEVFRRRKADIRICVVRDPVKRFASAYSNRILFHKDQDISLEDLIESLPDFQSVNAHFKPQVNYLGPDPSYYTHIYRMDQIPEIADLLSSLSGESIAVERLQTGGSSLKPELAPDQETRVRGFYSDDYAAFGELF